MGNFRVLVFLGLIGCALSSVPERSADTNTVFFRFYARNGRHIDINIRDAATKLLPLLDKNQMTTIYIHGYTESVDAESVVTVTDAYLSSGLTGNIIAIDYRQIADRNYVVGVINVDNVGKAIAGVLNKLIAGGLNPKKIHIVAHSLGAQVAGHVGKYVTIKILRITGLDPAGPAFYTGRYLRKSDALFVDIIHTDAGIFGETHNVGTVDFWPNKGHRPQAGCPLISLSQKDEAHCDHHRSWRYYAESVRRPNAFLAVKCDNSEEFDSGACRHANTIIMGWKTPTTASGTYYLRTNSKSPFGLGKRGI
ncbi:pancreatic triacylglycerol lipase-like [Nomia melanderi]|uniref:pancreatic triacylglycerol lipase-like n=1 Tax=Nomia melanderi TaxID=2448451 RepID=UPI0013042BE6|nr:pancreatic triacylglycerol lipase-like [Nomia melanderi]